MGRPKAAVLPVPVCACPTTSLPCKIRGIAVSCMGNGSLNPFSASAFVNCALKPNSSKVFVIFHFTLYIFVYIHKSHGRYEKSFSAQTRSEEHTSELQSRQYLVCRLLLEKKK